MNKYEITVITKALKDEVGGGSHFQQFTIEADAYETTTEGHEFSNRKDHLTTGIRT